MKISTQEFIDAIAPHRTLTGTETRNELVYIYATLLHEGTIVSGNGVTYKEDK